MKTRFYNEVDGSVVEYLMVIAMIAVIVAVLMPDLRKDVGCHFDRTISNVNIALDHIAVDEECSSFQGDLIQGDNPSTPPSSEGGLDSSKDATIELPVELDSSSCYVIRTIGQLQAMEMNLNACYVLGNDIDASGTRTWNSGSGFVPIGQSDSFRGRLDGNGKSIKGLTVQRSTNFAALIAQGTRAKISNVTLEQVDIQGGQFYTGSLIAFASAVTINNVKVSGDVRSSGYRVGGLIGYGGGSITNNSVLATVSGKEQVGGLVGETDVGSISNSMFNGTVYGQTRVGGIVGYMNGSNVSLIVERSFSKGEVIASVGMSGGIGGSLEGGSITNSYSVVKLTCERNCNGMMIGGLVGLMDAGVLSNSYFAGQTDLKGTSLSGGVIGAYYSGTRTNLFWDRELSSLTTSRGGTGLTTAQMKTPSSYTGFDFSGIWKSGPSQNSGYPFLLSVSP